MKERKGGKVQDKMFRRNTVIISIHLVITAVNITEPTYVSRRTNEFQIIRTRL